MVARRHHDHVDRDQAPEDGEEAGEKVVRVPASQPRGVPPVLDHDEDAVPDRRRPRAKVQVPAPLRRGAAVVLVGEQRVRVHPALHDGEGEDRDDEDPHEQAQDEEARDEDLQIREQVRAPLKVARDDERERLHAADDDRRAGHLDHPRPRRVRRGHHNLLGDVDPVDRVAPSPT